MENEGFTAYLLPLKKNLTGMLEGPRLCVQLSKTKQSSEISKTNLVRSFFEADKDCFLEAS